MKKPVLKIDQYERERISTSLKITRYEIERVGDDFIKDQMAALMVGVIYKKTLPPSEITQRIKRPTFLDWLLRREKIINLTVTVSDVLKSYPETSDNTYRIYDIKFKDDQQQSSYHNNISKL